MNNSVEDNVTYSRYELAITDRVIPAAYYRIEDNAVILAHTQAPFEYSGQGIASRLAEGVFELIRESGRKANTEVHLHGQVLSLASRIPRSNRGLIEAPLI